MSTPFRSSRMNRDRRDASLEQAVRQLAALRVEVVGVSFEAPEEIEMPLLALDDCIYCGFPLDDDTNHPYCSVGCSIDAEEEGGE